MELYYKINKPLPFVYDQITDMQKFVRAHPVIFRADSIDDNQYMIFEKLTFLFIPLTFTYKASVTGNIHSNRIKIKATVIKLVNIHIDFNLSEINNMTLISEKIEFRSYLPVHFIMKRIFRKQHQQLFRNIENAS